MPTISIFSVMCLPDNLLDAAVCGGLRQGFDNNWKGYGSIHCWKYSFWLLSFSFYVSLLLCLYCLSFIPIFPLHKVLSFDCKFCSTSLPYEDHNQKVHKLRNKTPLHSNHKSNKMDWCFLNLSMRYTPWLSSLSIHYSLWSRYPGPFGRF